VALRRNDARFSLPFLLPPAVAEIQRLRRGTLSPSKRSFGAFFFPFFPSRWACSQRSDFVGGDLCSTDGPPPPSPLPAAPAAFSFCLDPLPSAPLFMRISPGRPFSPFFPPLDDLGVGCVPQYLFPPPPRPITHRPRPWPFFRRREETRGEAARFSLPFFPYARERKALSPSSGGFGKRTSPSALCH